MTYPSQTSASYFHTALSFDCFPAVIINGAFSITVSHQLRNPRGSDHKCTKRVFTEHLVPVTMQCRRQRHCVQIWEVTRAVWLIHTAQILFASCHSSSLSFSFLKGSHDGKSGLLHLYPMVIFLFNPFFFFTQQKVMFLFLVRFPYSRALIWRIMGPPKLVFNEFQSHDHW